MRIMSPNQSTRYLSVLQLLHLECSSYGVLKEDSAFRNAMTMPACNPTFMLRLTKDPKVESSESSKTRI